MKDYPSFLRTVDFILESTFDSKDMGSKLLYLIVMGNKEQLEKFLARFDKPSSYTNLHDLIVCEHVRCTFDYVQQNQKAKDHLEQVAIERGLAAADRRLRQQMG